MADLGDYLEQFLHLRVNRGGGTPSPHKMCLLLAVIDLYDADPDRPNRIEYEPLLLERFREFFHAVKGPEDRERPWYPFFHLKSADFRHLEPQPDKEEAFRPLRDVRSTNQVLDHVAAARLDNLHDFRGGQEARLELNEAIARDWFGQGRQIASHQAPGSAHQFPARAARGKVIIDNMEQTAKNRWCDVVRRESVRMRDYQPSFRL